MHPVPVAPQVAAAGGVEGRAVAGRGGGVSPAGRPAHVGRRPRGRERGGDRHVAEDGGRRGAGAVIGRRGGEADEHRAGERVDRRRVHHRPRLPVVGHRGGDGRADALQAEPRRRAPAVEVDRAVGLGVRLGAGLEVDAEVREGEAHVRRARVLAGADHKGGLGPLGGGREGRDAGREHAVAGEWVDCEVHPVLSAPEVAPAGDREGPAAERGRPRRRRRADVHRRPRVRERSGTAGLDRPRLQLTHGHERGAAAGPAHEADGVALGRHEAEVVRVERSAVVGGVRRRDRQAHDVAPLAPDAHLHADRLEPSAVLGVETLLEGEPREPERLGEGVADARLGATGHLPRLKLEGLA